MSKPQDAKSEEGVVINLIDALITIFRVLKPKMKIYIEDEFTQPVLEAMKDLVEDEDVKEVLRSVSSGYIVSDEAVVVFNKIIEDIRNSKTKIEI